MFKVFEGEKDWFGIEDEHGAVLYESDTFDNKKEAQAFADAHNKGARSYSEAHAMIYGLEVIEAVEQSVHPTRLRRSEADESLKNRRAGNASRWGALRACHEKGK